MEKKKRTRKPKAVKPQETTWETPDEKTDIPQVFLAGTERDECGIVMIAIENPYYSHMAANNAAAIKSMSPETKITLVKNEAAYCMMRDDVKHLFDTVIECPSEYYNSIHGKDPLLVKLHLDKLSPYKRTLFLDADTIWLNRKKPDNLFTELKGIKFTMSNRGIKNASNIRDELKSRWVSIEEVSKVYGLQNVYDLASEVIYFEESFEATKVFEEARTVYKENKVQVNDFAGGKPDEVYFMIAVGLTDTVLHESEWLPAYWSPNYFPRIHQKDYIFNFYLLSVGGAVYASPIKKIYDSYANSCFQRVGIRRTAYQLIPKRSIMKTRNTI